MQSVSVFLDICWHFRWKNADGCRAQGVCHVIHIVFGSSLGKAWLCHVSSLYECVIDFRKIGTFLAPHPWTAPKRPILNRVNSFYFLSGVFYFPSAFFISTNFFSIIIPFIVPLITSLQCFFNFLLAFSSLRRFSSLQYFFIYLKNLLESSLNYKIGYLNRKDGVTRH